MIILPIASGPFLRTLKNVLLVNYELSYGYDNGAFGDPPGGPGFENPNKHVRGHDLQLKPDQIDFI